MQPGGNVNLKKNHLKITELLISTMADLSNIPVPSYNLVLRNPHFGIAGHAQAMIKAMLVTKIEDPRIDPGLEQLVLQSGFDQEAEDIYLNVLIDSEK